MALLTVGLLSSTLAATGGSGSTTGTCEATMAVEGSFVDGECVQAPAAVWCAEHPESCCPTWDDVV